MTWLTGILLAAAPDPDSVTPGPIGFLAIFLVAAATVLLGLDMVRRIRRTTYREEIKERLASEIAEKDAADRPAAETEQDDDTGTRRKPE